ncbi:MAG: 16S rRNA (uracil(1498)-N(3))-methyltransferase [Alphaproteobacteria bacterium]|nr:16S rRNA (uracil(1498)-N(3))-methyltransferase [Alphaproteobacteria bacterium]
MTGESRRYTPRIFLTCKLELGAQLEVGSEDTHYIGQVMRRKIGEDIIVFNGCDGEWRTEIIALTKKSARLDCREMVRSQQSSAPLALFFALIKRDHLDYLIQKASEIGVTHFFPLITQNCTIRNTNLDRLKSIAREASEQCDRLDVPTIAEPQSLASCLQQVAPALKLFACLEAGHTEFIASCFKQLPQEVSPGFLVGPEGGFSNAEREEIIAHPHVIPVNLGPRLLRADTAAIAALSCWQAICGDWSLREGNQS